MKKRKIHKKLLYEEKKKEKHAALTLLGSG